MNQVLQWSVSIDTVLQELYRVLRPQGCLMFSMLGPDTYQELRILPDVSVKVPLPDMHHIGDAMMNVGFDDPVLDMEMLTVRYRRFETLCDALKTQGIFVPSSSESKQLLCQEDERYPVTFEVIYGHGWRTVDRQKTVGVRHLYPWILLLKKAVMMTKILSPSECYDALLQQNNPFLLIILRFILPY